MPSANAEFTLDAATSAHLRLFSWPGEGGEGGVTMDMHCMMMKVVLMLLCVSYNVTHTYIQVCWFSCTHPTKQHIVMLGENCWLLLTSSST